MPMPGPSPESRALIERLIAFDTTSRNSSLELIEFVAGYLAEHGIESERIYNDERSKANLYATIGPADRGGIVLSGHTDVVPVDGQDWQSDPFSVNERDGRLYARGSADMKSFLGVVLAAVPRMVAAKLHTPLHLAFSYDEEIGCLGVRPLLAALAERPLRPRACIIGEPTSMRVIRGHKGKLSMRCHVTGHESHSGLAHLGVNAVEAAAEAIAFLKRLARRFRDGGARDEEFSPPYTTVHTGVVHGGTALNIVPKSCTFDFEFRHLPCDDPHKVFDELKRYIERDLEPEMHAVQPATGFRFEELSSFPGLDTAESADIVQLARALSGGNSTGKVSFGTEAGLFSDIDIPSVICGPGSIEQAHKPDEWIALEQIALCEQFMQRLLEHVSA